MPYTRTIYKNANKSKSKTNTMKSERIRKGRSAIASLFVYTFFFKKRYTTLRPIKKRNPSQKVRKKERSAPPYPLKRSPSGNATIPSPYPIHRSLETIARKRKGAANTNAYKRVSKEKLNTKNQTKHKAYKGYIYS